MTKTAGAVLCMINVLVAREFEQLVEVERFAKTEDYKDLMKLRGRIEPKQGEFVNHYGLHRAKYYGERKLAYQARM